MLEIYMYIPTIYMYIVTYTCYNIHEYSYNIHVRHFSFGQCIDYIVSNKRTDHFFNFFNLVKLKKQFFLLNNMIKYLIKS